jgi:hypothetical protein
MMSRLVPLICAKPPAAQKSRKVAFGAGTAPPARRR